MTNDIEKWKVEMKCFDNQIAPIANAPVDEKTLDVSFSQKEETTLTGVAENAQAVLCEIIDAYISGDDNFRDLIRQLFKRYENFAWAVYYKMKDNSSIEVKRYLAFLSIEDQGKDTRDFIMSCSSIFENFDKNGLEYKKELKEIVDISCKKDKYGMGSTASILRQWC